MTLKILPHGRLQEWVAQERGYFTAEGLDYTFLPADDYGSVRHHGAARVTDPPSGRPCRRAGGGRLPFRQPFRHPAGARSGAGPGQVSLTFQGPPNERLDALLDRQVPAGTMWGVPLYVAETFGFRKVLDTTFMIGFLVSRSGVSKADVDAYLAALRRAQQDIDLHPEAFKHYHLRAVPQKYRDQVDVRAFGTGERIVFLPYTREVFAATQAWSQDRDMFPDMPSPTGYDEAVLS